MPARSILVIFLALSIARLTTAQETTLSRTPLEDAAYFWTADSETLIQNSESLFSLNQGTWDTIWKVDDSSRFPDASELNLFNERSLERLQLLSELWDQLGSGEIFAGELLIKIPASAVTNSKPSAEQEKRRDSLSPSIADKLLIIAQSPAKHAEMEAFIGKLESVFEQQHLATTSKASSARRWKLEEGWFCWAQDQATAERVMDQLLKRQAVVKPIIDDRSFQTVFRNLNVDQDNQATCSFYVKNQMLPVVYDLLTEFRSGFSLVNLDSQSWKSLYLDDIRGVGGRIYLGENGINESLSAPLIFDSFLLCTRPRSGLLRALSQAPEDNLQLDFPIGESKLTKLNQWVIDGDELYRGMRQAKTREAAFRGIAFDERMITESSIPFFQKFSHLTEVDLSLGERNSLHSRHGVYARVIDRPSFCEFYEALSEIYKIVPYPSLPERHNGLELEDCLVTVKKDDAVDDAVTKLRMKIDSISSIIEKTRRERPEGWQDSIERMRGLRGQFESEIEEEEKSRVTPSLWIVGDWLSAVPGGPSTAIANGVKQQPQVLAVKDDIDGLRSELSIERNQCSLFVVWPSQRLELVNAESDRFQSSDQKADGVSLRKLEQSRLRQLTETTAAQFEHFFAIGTNEEAGLRISGALSKAKSESRESTN